MRRNVLSTVHGPSRARYGREIDIWAVGVVCYVLLSGSHARAPRFPHCRSWSNHTKLQILNDVS